MANTTYKKTYKTSEAKQDALKQMEDKDIKFLIYCSDNLYANIFYSKFLKEKEKLQYTKS